MVKQKYKLFLHCGQLLKGRMAAGRMEAFVRMEQLLFEGSKQL